MIAALWATVAGWSGWAKLAAWGGAILAGLAALALALRGARKQGEADANAKSATKINDQVRTRHAVDDAVARDPDPAERLRDKWSRD